MEVKLTAEMEARLHELATKTERTLDDVLTEMIQAQLDYDAWFRAEVQKGIDAVDRGDWLADAEVCRQLDDLIANRNQ